MRRMLLAQAAQVAAKDDSFPLLAMAGIGVVIVIIAGLVFKLVRPKTPWRLLVIVIGGIAAAAFLVGPHGNNLPVRGITIGILVLAGLAFLALIRVKRGRR